MVAWLAARAEPAKAEPRHKHQNSWKVDKMCKVDILLRGRMRLPAPSTLLGAEKSFSTIPYLQPSGVISPDIDSQNTRFAVRNLPANVTIRAAFPAFYSILSLRLV